MTRIILISLLLIISSLGVFAQPVLEEPCWPPSSCVPIDNGIIVLIIGGIALGAMTLIKRKDFAKY